MKKIINLLIVLAFTSFSTRTIAQTSQGRIILSGASTFSFGTQTEKNTFEGDQVGEKVKTGSFVLKPTAGYFVIDNLAIGITLVEEHSKSKFKDDVDIEHAQVENQLLLGPIGRYYYGTTSLKPFGQAELLFGSSKITNEVGGRSDVLEHYSTFGFGLGCGVAYFINEKIALDAILGYSYLINTDAEEKEFKNKKGKLDLSVGISILF